MPIQIKCQCGKALKVKDELAGKAVKCPGCGQPVRVGKATAKKPAAQRQAQAKQAPVRPTQAAAPAVAAGVDSLDDLFDEAGFSEHVAAICPSCRSEMSAQAVLCTKCGFNKETGESFEAHKTAGVDIDAGTLALDKAESDLDSAERAQKEMEAKAGMPWWMLSLVIFMLTAATTIAVLAVNASNQADKEITFNPMQLFLRLAGGAFGLAGCGALLRLGFLFAKQQHTKGQVIKLSIGFLVLSGVAIGFFIAAGRQ